MTNAPTGRGRHASHLHSSGHGWLTIGGRTLGVLLSLAILLAFGYGWYNYRALNQGIPRFKLNNLGVASVGPQNSTGPTTAAVHGTAQNILIVGLDSRAGLTPAQREMLHVGNDQTVSTDSMMIIHVPADGSKATMISLPRDSYVTIPGYQSAKLNAAYADGYTYTSGTEKQKEAAGADELIKTVKLLTGATIDHYVQVNFIGFYNIANAIHGVRVDLCHSVNDTFAYNHEHGLTGGSDFKMSAGWHTLDAVQSLEFVRQRHFLPLGDLDRVKRQQYFLTAAFHKIESAGVLLNPGRLSSLISAVKNSFTLDQNLNLSTLAEQMASLSAGHIRGYTIPDEGNATIAGQDVIQVDPVKVRAFVTKALNGTLPTHKKGHSSSSSTLNNNPEKGCID